MVWLWRDVVEARLFFASSWKHEMEQPEAKKQRFSSLSKDEIEKRLEQKDSQNIPRKVSDKSVLAYAYFTYTCSV